MNYPQKTYPNIQALLVDMNTLWVTNGQGKITGVIGNNIVNGLAKFIQESPLNWAEATPVGGGGVIVAGSLSTPGPVMLFYGTTPTSVSWDDNIYNQYVFINNTGAPIPLAGGFVYYDNFGNPQSNLLANQVTIIYKAPNGGGMWVLGNPTAAGSSGNVPDPTGQANKFLTTNGTIFTWGDTYLKIPVASFTSPTTYTSGALSGKYFDIFLNDVSRFLNSPSDPNPEWQYSGGTGFTITIPGFSLLGLSYPVYLHYKSTP